MISTKDILHSIAVNVVHSDHGVFLRTFADAYLGADTLNEEILRPAFLRLVKEYKLDEECELASFSRRILFEELVGVTTIKEFESIEEIKGSCPKCGGPLEFKEHVDAFNEDGSPIAEDTCRDPYCPSCKLLWLSQEASASQEKEEKIPAKCPICSEPVAYAYYDKEGKLYTNPPFIIIVSEANLAYHMNPGRDCWGKHTGYPTFKEAS